MILYAGAVSLNELVGIRVSIEETVIRDIREAQVESYLCKVSEGVL